MRRAFGTVYKITNKINGKCYIGQTKGSLEDRWKGHCDAARRGANIYFARAIRKYGSTNFSVEALARVPIVHLGLAEKIFIIDYGSYENGYNSTPGGEGWALGMHHSEKSKRKISEAHKGIKLSDEHRSRIAEVTKGNKSALGHRLSEEARKRLSHAIKQAFKNKDGYLFRVVEASRNRWKDPVFCRMMSEKNRLNAQKRWSNPDSRRRISIIHKNLWASPDYKEKMVMAAKRRWARQRGEQI